MAKLREFKGFASVRSDYYHSTPNLTVNIDRERAATYGCFHLGDPKLVEERLFAELRLFDQATGRPVSGYS